MLAEIAEQQSDEIIEVKENTCGFSRRMNPITQSQSTLQ